MAKFCFFLQISFVLLEFPSHFPQNLFPSNFLHFAKNSFQKEISFKVEALGQWQNIASNHGNIDIILIPERPFFSLLLSNNPHGKRAQELACAI